MEKIEIYTYLSLPSVAADTGVSANTILALSKAGSFPSPVDFNGDQVWLSAEVANWLESSPHSPMNFAFGEAA